MPRRLASLAPLALLLVALLLLPGCGDSHEKVGLDMLDAMEDYATILEGVKDVDSAKAAESKLKKLSERIDAINARREKLGEPDRAWADAFEEEHEQRFEKVGERMFAQMGRISELDPAVMAALDESARAMRPENLRP